MSTAFIEYNTHAHVNVRVHMFLLRAYCVFVCVHVSRKLKPETQAEGGNCAQR